MLRPKISSSKNIGQQKWGPSPETNLQICKQCVKQIFKCGIVSTITVSETVILKYQESRTLSLG